MTPVRCSALVAGSLLALAAPGAQAATRTLAPGGTSGPVLAGAKVLYGVDRNTSSSAGVDLRSVAVSGGKSSALYRFGRVNPKDETTNEVIGFDADGSRWAAVRQAFRITSAGPDSDAFPSGADLAAGELGRRPALLSSTFAKRPGPCCPRGSDEPGDVAVVDGGLAVAVTRGGFDTRGIALTRGSSTVLLKGRTPRGGGRWLAYLAGKAGVVVYDVKLRREAYRVTGKPGETPVAFDPQSDGKVVIQWTSTAIPRTDRLAWYSKAENGAHDLGVAPDELTAGRVAMAADTVVVPIETGVDPVGHRFAIAALSLTGERTKVDDVKDRGAPDGLDFDGRNVAWIDQAGVRVAALP